MARAPVTSAAAQRHRVERKTRHWRKWIQAVGLILLAVVCPFAAMFMGPSPRSRNNDNPTIEGER